MLDYKHFIVVHKPSNKIVSIFQMVNDATWIGKEKDKLIALPAETPENVSEIKMTFVNRFKRYKGTSKEQIITPFFRRLSGESETLSERKRESESKAHKLAKNEIYTKLFNAELLINGEDVNKIAKDMKIKEEGISYSGNSIADVLIEFDKLSPHPYYGLGICIEVQFSPQNDSKTGERTLSRLRDGWSVYWLWKEDFKDGQLKIKNLKIRSREEQLKNLRDNEYNIFLDKMNSIGKFIDTKIVESENIFFKETLRIKNLALEEISHKSECYKNKLVDCGEDIILSKREISKEIREGVEKLDLKIGELQNTHNKLLEELKNNFNIKKNELGNIDMEELKTSLINQSKEDPKFIEDFKDIFTKLKIRELMKSVEDQFPFHVREFFMQRFDKMLLDMKEDRWGDIKTRLDSINNEEDIKNPKERFLIEKSKSEVYQQKSLGEKYEEENN